MINKTYLGSEALKGRAFINKNVSAVDNSTVGRFVKYTAEGVIGAITSETDNVAGIHAVDLHNNKILAMSSSTVSVPLTISGSAIPVLTVSGDGGFSIGDSVTYNANGLADKTGAGVTNFVVVAKDKEAYKADNTITSDVVYIGTGA